MNDIQLRDYQKECIDIIDKLDKGSYLVSLPTGAGKTVVFSHIKRKGRVLILSHRDELVRQPLQYYDCDCGIEKAEETSNGEEVVSASVPSLIHRLNKFKPDDFDMIITDEAHHAVAPSYKKIYDYFNPRLHLGFTATPNRGDKKKLGEIFESVIYEKDIQWAIKRNYLCNIKCIRTDVGFDLSEVHSRMGDMNQEELSAIMEKFEINQAVVEAYNKYAVGPTVIFSTSVKQAYNIAELIPGCAVIEANTPNRAEVIHDFENGTVKCLSTVMVLTEGTDIPCIKTIIMARPTENQSLYIQCVGRGLRLYPGKEYLTLIDCVGITGRHKLCSAPVLFGLDPQTIPARKRKSMEGMITDLPKQMKKALDTPKSWIENAGLVDVFAQEEKIDLGGIYWFQWADNSFSCSLSNNETVLISPENDIGQRSCYLLSEGKYTLLIKDVSSQSAFYNARDFLVSKKSKCRALWDKKLVDKWGKSPASPKQIKFINSLLRNFKEYDKEDIPTKLTKRDAGIIINTLLTKKSKFQNTKNKSPH